MRRVLLIAVMLIFNAAGMAAAESGESIRFRTAEIFIDSGDEKLAAWQVEVRYDKQSVAIVGLEGGDAVFASPPYYDPRGMEGGRIVIASFTTDDAKAPAGKIRVTRLHLRISGSPELAIRLITAAKPGGTKITAIPPLTPYTSDEK